jgi:hypothetical protein
LAQLQPDRCGDGVIGAMDESCSGGRISTAAAWKWLRGGHPMRKRGRWSGTRLPAQDSYGAAMCHLGSSTRLPTQDSSGGATCPRGSDSHLPT